MRPSQIWRAVIQFFDFLIELQKVATPQSIWKLFLSPVLVFPEESSNPSHRLSIDYIFHLKFQFKFFRQSPELVDQVWRDGGSSQEIWGWTQERNRLWGCLFLQLSEEVKKLDSRASDLRWSHKILHSNSKSIKTTKLPLNLKTNPQMQTTMILWISSDLWPISLRKQNVQWVVT